jgi:hypothetical protein
METKGNSQSMYKDYKYNEAERDRSQATLINEAPYDTCQDQNNIMKPHLPLLRQHLDHI